MHVHLFVLFILTDPLNLLTKLVQRICSFIRIDLLAFCGYRKAKSNAINMYVRFCEKYSLYPRLLTSATVTAFDCYFID